MRRRRRAILEAVLAVLGARSRAMSGDGQAAAGLRFAELPPGQAALDRVADTALQTAPRHVEPWIGALRRLVNEAGSLQAIWSALPTLCRVPHQSLGDHLGEALAAADALGVATVRQHLAGAHQEARAAAEPFLGATQLWRAIGRSYAGNLQADMAAAVRGEVDRALTDGTALPEFRQALWRLADEQGVPGLTPARIETIYRTNLQRAFMGARYRELRDPETMAAFPYWRYVAVLDTRTRPAHRALHGKIYRADDPVWQTIYPPSGWNCRCGVQPVSEYELGQRGWQVDTDLPDVWEPDEQWLGGRETLPTLLQDQQALRAVVRFREDKAQPHLHALGFPTDAEIAETSWPPWQMAERWEDRIRAGRSPSEALTDIEMEFRGAFGIAPHESAGYVIGPDGEAVAVNLRSLAHAMAKRRDARERFLPLFRPTLETPDELVRSRYLSINDPPSGLPREEKWRKKYLKYFTDPETNRMLLISAEELPEGWVAWNMIEHPMDLRTLASWRRGMERLWPPPERL